MTESAPSPAMSSKQALVPRSRLVLSSDAEPGMLMQDADDDHVKVLQSSRCLTDATQDTFYNDKSAPALPSAVKSLKELVPSALRPESPFTSPTSSPSESNRGKAGFKKNG